MGWGGGGSLGKFKGLEYSPHTEKMNGTETHKCLSLLGRGNGEGLLNMLSFYRQEKQSLLPKFSGDPQGRQQQN